MSLQLSIVTLVFFLSTSSFAQKFPPDYPAHTESTISFIRNFNPVNITRKMAYDWASLRISYSGDLLNRITENPNLKYKFKVWLKLNGMDAIFPMIVDIYPNGSIEASLFISNGPRNCYSYDKDNFRCETPSEEMQKVLLFSKPSNDPRTLNAWDIEMAFFIEGTDYWDNNGGYNLNHRFHFDAYSLP